MTMNPTLDACFDDYLSRHAVLATRVAHLRSHCVALTAWIGAQPRSNEALIVGINGAQGSGKSTLVALLQHLLEQGLRLRTVVLSLDDFYLTRAERETLGRTVHPLLVTRGVPGTHDVALAMRTLDRLLSLGDGEPMSLPRFIKARDDRAPEHDGHGCSGPVDIVLFEGWCVGTPPQDGNELAMPINALESREDTDGRWRDYVNEQLKTSYAELYSRLDRLVLLQAPSFEVVHGWRLEQEADNAAGAADSSRIMTSSELAFFVAHYERLTRHALRVLPARADVVLEMDERRRISAIRY